MMIDLPLHLAVVDSTAPHLNRPWGECHPSLSGFCDWIKATAKEFPRADRPEARYVRFELDTMYVVLDEAEGETAPAKAAQTIDGPSVIKASAYKNTSYAWQLTGLLLDLSNKVLTRELESGILDFVEYVCGSKKIASQMEAAAAASRLIRFGVWIIMTAEEGEVGIPAAGQRLMDAIKRCAEAALDAEVRVEPCLDHRMAAVQVQHYLLNIPYAKLAMAGT